MEQTQHVLRDAQALLDVSKYSLSREKRSPSRGDFPAHAMIELLNKSF